MALALALVVTSATSACRRGDTPLAEAARSSSAPPEAPWLEEVSRASGVEFIHQVEVSGRYLFPESIGCGVAVLDFDQDGMLDLFFVHNSPAASGAANGLFRQEAPGRFRRVTDQAGLGEPGLASGVAVGDVNNDGLPEILITEYDRVRLFLNRSPGPFEEMTAAAGITNRSWSVPAIFVDYDRDGRLDLVIGNYLDFDPTQKCLDARGRPDFCGPHGFRPTLTRLYHNVTARSGPGAGRPRFEDVTLSSGLARAPGKAMGMVAADFDGDGWPDLFITDDGLPNRLFMNQHNGTFREEGVVRGLAYTGTGAAAANMGIALGDIDGDGLFDLFVPHLGGENHTCWRQGPRGAFFDQSAAAGVLSLATHGTGFGAVLADFDLDGSPDLAIANGMVRRRPGDAPAPAGTSAGLPAFWRPYAEAPQLFRNDGTGRFQEISASNPGWCGEWVVGRGLIVADLDNDGAPDLVASPIASRAQLLRNVAPRRGHWIGLRLVEPAFGGRDAYGAEVEIRSGGRRRWAQVQPGGSYASSGDPRILFGLGPSRSIEELLVTWPDGTRERFEANPVDRYHTLRHGAGRRTGDGGQE